MKNAETSGLFCEKNSQEQKIPTLVGIFFAIQMILLEYAAPGGQPIWRNY
jgi:hypothetical protein